MATIKPKTNIPLIGTLMYVNYAKSKTEGWKDQVGLKGTWDGEEGTVYCPLFIKDVLFDLALIEKPTDTDGNREVDKYGGNRYIVNGQPRIMLTKSETEGDEPGKTAIRWNVNLCDSAGANDQPRPSNMPCDKESAEANFPEQPPHPADRATSHNEAVVDYDEAWTTIHDRWVKAAGFAVAAHIDADLEVDNDRLAQTATAFFIEACRRNLR